MLYIKKYPILYGLIFIFCFAQFGCSHFLVYDLKSAKVRPIEVQLQTRFDPIHYDHEIIELTHFTTPIEKRHHGKRYRMRQKDHHLTWYALKDTSEEQRSFIIRNQFGKSQEITTGDPKFLLVPSGKHTSLGEHFDIPTNISHYKVYEVVSYQNAPADRVQVRDQFIRDLQVDVLQPIYYAVPVTKIHGNRITMRRNRDRDIIFYVLKSAEQKPVEPNVSAFDQFRRGPIELQKRVFLGAHSISRQIEPPEKVGHFLVYDIADQPITAHAELEGRLFPGTLPVVLNALSHFATPVEKQHEEAVNEIVDENHHAKWYEIEPGPFSGDTVSGTNQFGEYHYVLENYRQLMTPAGKELLDPNKTYPTPKTLSHYLIYRIRADLLGQNPGNAILTDQFTNNLEVNVTKAIYYGIPVAKTHKGKRFEILNELDDLVFYLIETKKEQELPLLAASRDQFARHPIDFRERLFLGVPSRR